MDIGSTIGEFISHVGITDFTTNNPDTPEMTSMIMTPMMTTVAPIVAEETVIKPSSQYDYGTATFEIILPVIFGIFISITMSLVMFYQKKLTKKEELEWQSRNKIRQIQSTNVPELFKTQFENTEWQNAGDLLA